MSKAELVITIDSVLVYFSDSSSAMGQTIFKRYRILKDMIATDAINYNPIKGSVRAYLDACNDWDNPILEIMWELENTLERIVQG